MSIKAISVTEYEPGEVYEFKSKEHLQWFDKGFREGAYEYGAGMAGVFTRDHLQYLNLDAPTDQTIAEIINQYLPM